MATHLRQVPANQEFVDDDALADWRVIVGMGQNKRGAWVVAKLTIEPKARTLRQAFRLDVPSGGITARLLRELSLHGVYSYAARAMAADSYAPPPSLRKVKAPARPGRPNVYPRAWYARLAVAYETLAARGVPDVARHLSRSFKKPDGDVLTRGAMRSAIRRARAMGLLGGAIHGRAWSGPPNALAKSND